jgi:hypothetical protein
VWLANLTLPLQSFRTLGEALAAVKSASSNSRKARRMYLTIGQMIGWGFMLICVGFGLGERLGNSRRE